MVLAVTSETAFLTIKGLPNLVRVRKFLAEYFASKSVIVVAPKPLAREVQIILGESDKPDTFLTCQILDSHALAKSLEKLLLNFEAVFIHDASRPWVSQNQFDTVLDAMSSDVDAVRPAMAFTETLKVLSSQSKILGTLDRFKVLRISTPELIRISAIDLHESDSGWFLPLRKGANVLHVESEPQSVRINSEADRDLLEFY